MNIQKMALGAVGGAAGFAFLVGLVMYFFFGIHDFRLFLATFLCLPVGGFLTVLIMYFSQGK